MRKTRLRRSDPERERHWREVVRGQEESGQSVRAYCRDAGIGEAAFYWWRRKLARRSEVGKAARSRPPSGRKPARSSAGHGSVRLGKSQRVRKRGRDKSAAKVPGGGPSGRNASAFVPVRVFEGNAPAGVEIHLGDGRVICVRPGFDRQTLRDVVAALEGGPC